MNTRQWQLYNLIKTNSLVGRKTTQQEICEKIDGYEYRDRKGTTDKCSDIWNDIAEINRSGDTDKLIITKKYQYWIGDREETTQYLDDYWKQIAPSLVRYWAMVKKAKNNGQYKLLSNRLNPIDDTSKARAYVESFIEKTLDEMNREELMEQDIPTLKEYLKSLGGMGYGGWRVKDYVDEIILIRSQNGI